MLPAADLRPEHSDDDPLGRMMAFTPEEVEDTPKLLKTLHSKQDFLERRLEIWFAEVVDLISKGQRTPSEAHRVPRVVSALQVSPRTDSRPDFKRPLRPPPSSRQEAPSPEDAQDCNPKMPLDRVTFQMIPSSHARTTQASTFQVGLQSPDVAACSRFRESNTSSTTTQSPRFCEELPPGTRQRRSAPSEKSKLSKTSPGGSSKTSKWSSSAPNGFQVKTSDEGTSSETLSKVNTAFDEEGRKSQAEKILAEWQKVQPAHKKRSAPATTIEISRLSAISQPAETNSRKRLGRPSGMLQYAIFRIVCNPVFDAICAFMIICNSALIGYTVEWLTTHPKEEAWSIIVGHLCSLFFFVELIMRMTVKGRFYFFGEDKMWNVFDFSLVAFSVVEFIMDITNIGSSSVGSNIKTIKMLRIVRIFRVFRFFRELSLLAIMIADSIRSLMWALVMLAIIIYVFAICFTSSASEYLNVRDPEYTQAVTKTVHTRFGSLPRTVYSLLLSMLNGISWEAVSDPLMHINGFVTALFFFYVAFTMLAVLNIITGVFVDNAVETARTQRDFLVEKEMELRERYIMELHDIFEEMDTDGSGTLSLDEIKAFLNDLRVQSYFQALGLDTHDTERLFRLIDDDASGEVAVQEFLDGCLRLKGEARSIDVHAVMYDCKELMRVVEDVHQMVWDLSIALDIEPTQALQSSCAA